MIKVEKLDGYIVISNGISSIIISKNDRWITIKRNHEDKEEKGRHLLLEDGETPAEAMKRQWGVDLKGKDKPKDSPEQKEQPKTEEKPKEEEKEDLSKYTDDELQDLVDKAMFETQNLDKQKMHDIDSNEEVRKIQDEIDKLIEESWKEPIDSPKLREIYEKKDEAVDRRNKKLTELDKKWEEEHQEERRKANETHAKYFGEQNRRYLEAQKKKIQEKEEAEQKRTKELSDAYTNFKPAKDIEEAKKAIAVITGHNYNTVPADVNIDNINESTKTALEMISKYNIKDGLKTFGVGRMRGGTLMHANQDIVEISPKLAKASKAEIEETYNNISKPREEKLKDSIKRANENIEHYQKDVEELEAKRASGERVSEWDITWKKSRIKEEQKALKQYEKSAKFIRWTTQTSAENFVRDTTYHEFGHVVMDRALEKDFAGVNKAVASAMMKARKTGDIYKISEYANTNKNEFFAEVFAMRQTNQDLPDYINDMLDTVTGKKSA